MTRLAATFLAIAFLTSFASCKTASITNAANMTSASTSVTPTPSYITVSGRLCPFYCPSEEHAGSPECACYYGYSTTPTAAAAPITASAVTDTVSCPPSMTAPISQFTNGVVPHADRIPQGGLAALLAGIVGAWAM